MAQKVFRLELPYGTLTVFPQDDKIVVLCESEGETGLINALTRDQAHMLHTDLGEMLGSFVLSEGE